MSDFEVDLRLSLLKKCLGDEGLVVCQACGYPWTCKPMGDRLICHCRAEVPMDEFHRGLYYGALDMFELMFKWHKGLPK